MASSSLIKTILHKSLAEGVYRDVTTKSSTYYYFLGKTLSWDDELNPPYPIDSYAYERSVRNEIITMKQIGPSDVSFVVPRRNWVASTVYDMYDDEYSNQIIGLDIVSGGAGYNTIPTITISGGGGTGAQYTAAILDGEIVDVDLVSKGTGYTSVPTVTVTGGGGTGAELRAVLPLAHSGENNLEDANFYVMTEDFNVYKCLDNNNNSRSTAKPSGTSVAPITTQDGYIWKYMYNVPINLRSKFLDDNYIPVVSALTNQFYSNGTVDNVIINNKGTGYTTATITVTGDGYRQEDPIFLNSIVINNGGTGYTTPTVLIEDPVPSSSEFIGSSAVFLGQRIYNSSGDFYEISSPGTLSTSEPTHRLGTIQNGTAALKFVGSRARATATVTSGVITSVDLIGAVREINLVTGGFGYTSAPTVTFGGGGGSLATAVAKMNTETGSVLFCTIVNPGDNYTSDPTVTFGNAWTAVTEVLVGEQYFAANRLYTVTFAGTTGSTAPTHSTGEQTNGTAKLTYAGAPATGSVVRRFGYGYSTVPSVTFLGGSTTPASLVVTVSKSEAKILPVLENGQIVAVTAENTGIGYSTATLAVTGDGTGAAIQADLNIGNIQSLQANNEILTTAGTINAIKIISGGYDYGVANISILGDGAGATAVAEIDTALGRITKINITNPGSGYTFANIVISGNGKAGKARAIISPFGGHGKNAPDELFSRTLVFYSNVSNDLNQGLEVNNDYRQLGIIKNPRSYNSNNRFNSIIGTSCFLVQGAINTTRFPRDTNIRVARVIGGVTFYRNYRVVTSTSAAALLQSLDNDVPQINDIFENDARESFTAASVSNPTVDKYSGQMMFIDNKAGFTPSDEETVTLRTIIRF